MGPNMKGNFNHFWSKLLVIIPTSMQNFMANKMEVTLKFDLLKGIC